MNKLKLLLEGTDTKKRILLFIVTCLTVSNVWICSIDLGPFPVEACIARCFLVFVAGYAAAYFIREKKELVLLLLKQTAVICALFVCSILITYILAKTGFFNSFSKRMIFAVLTVLVLIYVFTLYIRKSITDNVYMAVIVFIIGTIYALSYPAGLGITWDDQIHYEGILQLSHVSTEEISQADNTLMMSAYPDNNMYLLTTLHEGKTGKFEKTVNREYESGELIEHKPLEMRRGVKLSYIPEAMTLLLGRGINIPYVYVFAAGRWIGVLLYSLLLLLSFSQLKSGKIILFMISMCPMTVAMMSNYSYDPWAIGLSMFAFAYYIGIMQDENRKITLKDTILICAAFALAFAAKPNYFCIILILLFTEKTKLDEKLSPRYYRAIVIITSALLAATFVIPFLVSGAGGDDTRGFGDAVNSAEQIKFMLGNPLHYMYVLLNHLKDYWSMSFMSQRMVFFGYLGIGKYGMIYVCFALVIAILDKSKEDNLVTTAIRRTSTLVLVFGASCIFATIMYIGFTPVGSDTIEGCQARYALPLFAFIGYYISDYRLVGKIRNHITDKSLIIITSAITVTYAYYCLGSFVLCYY